MREMPILAHRAAAPDVTVSVRYNQVGAPTRIASRTEVAVERTIWMQANATAL